MSIPIESSLIRFGISRQATAIGWQDAPSNRVVVEGDIHLWCLSLESVDDLAAAQLEATLCDAEKSRAAKFQTDRLRRRFVVGRGLLRSVLGSYLSQSPREIQFEYERRGKPFLKKTDGVDRLEFSVSHSEEIALFAVAKGQVVGVDVEHLKKDIDAELIAREFFPADEAAVVAAAPHDRRHEIFLRLWTRREAILKASGIGLAGLDAVARSAPPGVIEAKWLVHEFRPEPSLVAALAIPRDFGGICGYPNFSADMRNRQKR